MKATKTMHSDGKTYLTQVVENDFARWIIKGNSEIEWEMIEDMKNVTIAHGYDNYSAPYESVTLIVFDDKATMIATEKTKVRLEYGFDLLQGEFELLELEDDLMMDLM